MSKPDGGQAFPVPPVAYDRETGNRFPTEGMTMRDYFAAKAMQGMCAAMSELKPDTTQQAVAKEAYEIADAMIGERAK